MKLNQSSQNFLNINQINKNLWTAITSLIAVIIEQAKLRNKTRLKLDSKFNLLFRAYPSEVDVGRSHDPFLVGVQIPGVGRQGEALVVRRQVQGEGN